MTTKKLGTIAVESVRDEYRAPIAPGIGGSRTQHHPGITSGDPHECLAPGSARCSSNMNTADVSTYFVMLFHESTVT